VFISRLHKSKSAAVTFAIVMLVFVLQLFWQFLEGPHVLARRGGAHVSLKFD
jgi:hypothetical protein